MFSHTRLRFLVLGVVLCTRVCDAQQGGPEASLQACADAAWHASWSRFYKPETHLFYDYLTSYERGKELAHLPTADEVRRQYPNTCGYGTGMEDGMISAGVMLDMTVDRYAVTGETNLPACAREIVKGIRLCTLGHGFTGFVARAVCHEDLTSIYISSSRDQYTHAVHGLWRYARSPLAGVADRKQAAELLAAIADRMLRNVTPENGYDSLRADGTRDDRGISTMWNVQGHEAARLPMIYAAAWDLTRRPAYHEAYRRYVAPAVEQSLAFEAKHANHPSWVLPQMQGSLELLDALETDPALKKQIAEAMRRVSVRCAARASAAVKRADTLDLQAVAPDWRVSGGLVNPYRLSWYAVREVGEALIGMLMDERRALPESAQRDLAAMLHKLDYDRASTCGIFHLQCAYWKARRRGLFQQGPTPVQQQAMQETLERFWQRLNTQYYSPKTHLFYASPVDRVAPARLFTGGFLDPDTAQVGYGPGMADCAIFNGVLLSMLVDRHAATQDPALAATARDVFEGLRGCATVHGVPGFVARGICAEDGRGVCLTSSRDQVTHFVHGLWRYARSPLCSDATRDEIRTLLRAVADRMLRNVTPENDYDFLRADGTRDPRGICRMWEVRPHEAARLPMVYAAAWDLSRNDTYHAAYRRYLAPAVEHSLAVAAMPPAEVSRWMPCYTLLQMQSSLELLHELERDAALKGKLAEAMRVIAGMAEKRAAGLNGFDDAGSICASGETALAQLMTPGFAYAPHQRDLLMTMITGEAHRSPGAARIIHVTAAYWRARRLGVLTPP